MHRSEWQGQGSAHGKVILLGEHAVVYGHPAIALPFSSVAVDVQVIPVTGLDALDCAYYRGPLAAAPKTLLGLRVMIPAIRDRLGASDDPVRIVITSTIPAGFGLGSSAAVAVGTIRALYDRYRVPLSREELWDLAHLAETVVHGTPSGIDVRAASTDSPLWFTRGEGLTTLLLPRRLFLVVATSNSPGHTGIMVRRVQASRPRTNGPIERLGALTHAARDCLASGDYKLLGTLLTEGHQELRALNVTTPDVDRLVEAALLGQALGAKLTGSGGGGTIIALAPDATGQRNLARTLQRAGAKNVWALTTLERDVTP